MSLIVYDRQKLYEEVWSEPLTVVAKRYGISDVALRKHCVKLNVPLPGRGYWAQLKAGAKVERKPLLPNLGQERLAIRHNSVQQKNQERKQMQKLWFLSEERRSEIEDACAKLVVPERLVKPHPLVRDTIEYSKKKNKQDNVDKNNVLNIGVSKEQFGRSLRVMDILLKAIEALGYSVKNKYMVTKIIINGEEIKIGIREKQKQEVHILTKDELAYEAKWGHVYAPTFDYSPSGLLTLYIDEYDAARKTWNDTKNQKIEKFIGELVISLIETAEDLRLEHEQREAKHQEWQEEQERRLRLQELREKEKEKFAALELQADNYRRAMTVREYASALEAKAAGLSDITQRAKLLEYIEWAKTKADWLNPLVANKDPILGIIKYNDDGDY